MRTSFKTLTSILFISACSEYEVKESSPPAEPESTQLFLSPPSIDMGSLTIGETEVATFELYASGGDVRINDLSLAATWFWIDSDLSGQTLAKDSTETITIVFEANELGSFSDSLTVNSDAEIGAQLSSTLQVEVVEEDDGDDEEDNPQISVTPLQLVIPYGEGKWTDVTSVGSTDLDVLSVQLSANSSPGFSIANDGGIPLTLAPNDSTRIVVEYEGAGGPGVLEISSSDPNQPLIEVQLIGEPDSCETIDADGDGSNACDDCDDNDPGRAPHLAEICDDGIDQDCDNQDATSITLGLLPGWGGGASDSNLIWPSFIQDWGNYGTCPLNLVDVPPGFDVNALIQSNATSLVITDPAGGSIQYSPTELQAIRDYTTGGHGGIIATYLISWNGWNFTDLYDNSSLSDLMGIDPAQVALPHVENVQTLVNVTAPAHPLSDGLGSSYSVTSYPYSQGKLSPSWADALLPGAEIVAEASDGHMVTVAYQGNGWRGVWFTGMADYDTGAPQAMYNAALWTGAN